MRRQDEKKTVFESMCLDIYGWLLRMTSGAGSLVKFRSPPLNHDKLSMDLVRSCIFADSIRQRRWVTVIVPATVVEDTISDIEEMDKSGSICKWGTPLVASAIIGLRFCLSSHPFIVILTYVFHHIRQVHDPMDSVYYVSQVEIFVHFVKPDNQQTSNPLLTTTK
jgi:hypothetical protein